MDVKPNYDVPTVIVSAIFSGFAIGVLVGAILFCMCSIFGEVLCSIFEVGTYIRNQISKRKALKKSTNSESQNQRSTVIDLQPRNDMNNANQHEYINIQP